MERGRQSFTGALAAIVGDRNVEINDGRSTADPIRLPAVNHGGEREVSANGCWHVGQTLGRSTTSSLHACRLWGPIHTKLGLEREETSGSRGASKLLDDEDELTVQQLAQQQDQPPCP